MPGDGGGELRGKKARVEIPETLRRELEASGQQLEAGAVIEGDRNLLVLVYRASMEAGCFPRGRRESSGSPGESTPYGSLRASCSRLPSTTGTLKSNRRRLENGRKQDGKGAAPSAKRVLPALGIGLESRYQKRCELDEFHRRFAPALVNAPVTGSAELTYGTGGFWLLCTPVEPENSRDFERLQKEFPQYDCATTIPDPSALALQLGKDFGSRHGEEAVHANAYEILRLAKIAGGFIGAGEPVPEAVVDVRHGQMVYSDEAADLIESYPSQVQGMVHPLVKRTKLPGEKEYRFTVSLGGEPKKQHVCVDVSEELRSLVKPYSDG